MAQVLTAEQFDNFLNNQDCQDCPIKRQCDYATDEINTFSVCSIIQGNMPGYDEYQDNHQPSPVEG